MIRISWLVACAICLVLILLDLAVFQSSLFYPDSIRTDGAYTQYLYIHSLIENSELWKVVQENPITLIHTFRYIVYAPFLKMGENGIPFQYMLLLIAALPVAYHYFSKPIHLVLFIPLLLPLFISYRAVFAGLGIGYIVIYLYSSRKYVYFVMSILFCLVSTSVSIQLLLLIFTYTFFREHRFLMRARHFIPIGVFVFILLQALSIKMQGFLLGADGYAATIGGQSPGLFVTIFSRGTLFYELFRGNSRGYLYAIIALVTSYLIIRTLSSRNRKTADYRLILLPLAPGFLAEGLGVTSIMFVLFWAVLRVDLRNNGNIKRRRAAPAPS